jgi:CRP-like cAMP-binding protein
VIRPTGDTRAEQEEERITHEQVEALVPYGRELRLAAGDYLFNEKGVVDSFYVVLEGEIRISRLDGAEETHIVTHRAASSPAVSRCSPAGPQSIGRDPSL